MPSIGNSDTQVASWKLGNKAGLHAGIIDIFLDIHSRLLLSPQVPIVAAPALKC